MVNAYSLTRISVISSYIIANKTLILSIFCKWRSSYFPAKTHVVKHRFSNLKVLDITTETLLINNVKENVSELVNITEVKFIKKFLYAVFENCHGKKWLKLNVHIVNHNGNVHGKQSLMIISSSVLIHRHNQ